MPIPTKSKTRETVRLMLCVFKVIRRSTLVNYINFIRTKKRIKANPLIDDLVQNSYFTSRTVNNEEFICMENADMNIAAADAFDIYYAVLRSNYLFDDEENVIKKEDAKVYVAEYPYDFTFVCNDTRYNVIMYNQTGTRRILTHNDRPAPGILIIGKPTGYKDSYMEVLQAGIEIAAPYVVAHPRNKKPAGEARYFFSQE